MFTDLLLSLLVTAAAAPELDRPIARYLERSAYVAIELSAPRVQSRGDDPLKDGAIVGAVIGGLAAGTFIGLLCHAVNDTGDPICWKAALLWGGIGAGGGAAIGAGIDSLLTRRATVTASVRF